MQTFRLHPIVNGLCGCGDPTCPNVGKHPAEAWRNLDRETNGLQPTFDQGIGIAAGARSGIFVVDVDRKNGVDGLTSLAKLGPLPTTYTVETPTGGYHLYFRHPGFPVRNSGPNSHPIAPGVDIRGDGGYVVAPGSPHKNGGRYSVYVNAPIVDAPDWLLAWPGLRKTEAKESAPVEVIEERLADVPKEWRIAQAKAWLTAQPSAFERQGGDGHTFRLVAQAVHQFCLTDKDMIDKAFVEWNLRCEPPWTGKEWAHKVDSALHKSTLPWNTAIALTYAHETAQKPDAPPGAPVPGAPSEETLGFEFGCWETEPPPIEFLVDGLLPKGCVGMFYGRADALKTWLLFSLGLSVATGTTWLGRFPVAKALRVGIVDFETGRANVDRRLFMLGAGNVTNLGRKSFAKLKPNDPKFWQALAREKFDLVIIDSLRRANPGANENESGEAIKPLELAAEFSEPTGCAVLFIHHAKKDMADGWPEFRGSGAIEDQVDVSFAVKKTDVSAEVKTVEIRCEKPGDMVKPAPFSVEVRFDDLARKASLKWVEGKKAAKEDEKPEDNRAKALRILRANPTGVRKQALLDSLEGTKLVRDRVLADLEIAGITHEFRQGRMVYVMLNPNAPEAK